MIKKTIRKTILGGLLLSSFATHATVIDFFAEGTGNIPNGWSEVDSENSYINDDESNFFKVIFSSGHVGESITQVSFDLRAGTDVDAYFDPSDGSTDAVFNDDSGKGFGPIIGADTIGLSSADVTFSLNPNSGINHILTINFLINSFGVGDVLSFGIDIDKLNGRSEDLAGGLLGLQSVGASVELSGSCRAGGATNFQQETRNRSSAQVSFCRESVPEPSTWLLLLIAPLLMKLSRGLKRKESL